MPAETLTKRPAPTSQTFAGLDKPPERPASRAGSGGIGRCDAGSSPGWVPRPRDRQRGGSRVRVQGSGRRVGCHQISVAPLITLLGLYFWILQRRWPLATTRDALSVGAVWVTLSVLFEFGFGHYVEGDSWSDLFETYNVAEGNIWILILLWIAVGPAIARAVAAERSA